MNKPQISVLSRNALLYKRSSKLDIHKVYRNFDDKIHPFSYTREYNIALNSAKLDRIFAKPFVTSLDGHHDSVYCLAKHPKQISILFSGACDGEIKIWNLSGRKSLYTIAAHKGFVRGICIGGNSTNFISIGDDKMIKIWKDCSMQGSEYISYKSNSFSIEPLLEIPTSTMLMGIDHNCNNLKYGICGTGHVDIRDETLSQPIMTFKWDLVNSSTFEFNTMSSIKFNQIESNLLACTCSDRSILFYDIRTLTPIKKLILQMKSNSLAWNPMEPYYITCANEDSNLYTFDIRNFTKAVNVHRDNLSAILDVDYCPTGREIVSAGFDKTIRIFPVKGHGHSREIYHTRRMQHVLGVKWSLDSKYIVSCSDETNIRIWKANASEKFSVTNYRERLSIQYKDYLKEKYREYPQVKRIINHRHIPKVLYKSIHEKKLVESNQRRKIIKRKMYSKYCEDSSDNPLRKNIIVSVKD